MTSSPSTTANDTAASPRVRAAFNRHRAFIESRLPAPLKQPGSACLKALAKISATAPAWYSQADQELRTAFEISQLARCTSQHQLEAILQRITPLDAFATPLLEQAILKESGLTLDVRNTYFVRKMHNRRPSSFAGLLDFSAGDPKVRTWYWNVSLLEAALHNFSAEEAGKPPAAGNEFITHDHSGDAVRIGAHDPGRELPLRPERFAALCRTLDLGQRYQAHLDTVLNPADTEQKALVRQTWVKHRQNELTEAVHLARLQDLVPEDAYQALLHWLDGHADIRLGGHRLRPWRLRMLGVDLGEIIFLRPDSGPSPWRCLAYLPGDDAQPLRHYVSSAAFMIDLRTRLHSAKYRRFFSQFVPVREQPAFFAALKKRLDPTDRHDLWDDYPVDPDLRVGLELVELAPRVGANPTLETLLKDQCELKFSRMLSDARALAVPTDEEDRAARTARFLAAFDAGMDLLNLLVFIPGIGQVMLLAIGTRMLHEVYSGIEAWEDGDTRQAWAHLLGVAMNVALVGVAGTVLPSLDTSAFVDALIPVSVRKGVTRLWKADLTPYRHHPLLPARSLPDRLGLHEAADGRYLRLEEHYYRLLPDARPGRYRARHVRAGELLNPYAAEFRSNGHGAWRHELDSPLEWSQPRLFSRLGPDAAGLDAPTAQRILHITGVDSDVLRALHHDNGQPPALLSDTLTRFVLDQDLARLVHRLQNGATSSGSPDELHMELQLLTSDPVWPGTKVLRLLNNAGRTLQEYPANQGADVARIEVSWPGLDAEGLLRQVLGKLDEGEIRSLLREEFGQGPLSVSARVVALRRRLAGDALKRRTDLFESHYRYRTTATTGEPGAAVVRRDFPGLPERLVQELAGAANPAERAQLERARVPLRLAEEARHYLRNVRLARLYEPLYLDSVSQAELYRIVLPQLAKLPGWSSKVRLEIRDDHFSGPLLDSLGAKSATVGKVLVRNAGLYETYDDIGQALHGPDDLYSSVLHALPDAERAALGFPHVGQGMALKQALRALPPLPREELARLQALPLLKPGFVPPMRLADGRLGYALSGRAGGSGQRSYAIGRLARELYPRLTIAEVETLHDLRNLSLGEAISRLRALESEYRTLENELDTWVGESPDAANQNRSRWAMQIRRCWRRETDRAIDNDGDPVIIDHNGTPVDGYELTLSGYPVEPLPTLSAPLIHVAELQLRGLLLPNSAALEGFLGHFPNLLRLNLSGNLLTRLPTALAQMKQLRHLEFRNNQIVIGADTQNPLTHLERLETLNLENNPNLSRLPNLSPMSRLRCLYLRNTGLTGFPQGYDQLPELRRLDLRDNRIDQVPDAVFGMSTDRQRLNMTINLDDNLIPLDVHRRIEQYRQQTGIDLGLEPLIESGEHSDWSNHSRPASGASTYHNRWGSPSPVPRDSQPWLVGLDALQQQTRRNVWLRLASDDIEASEAFFKVLADLRNSADYLQDEGAHRPQLLERVWRMVKAAEQDSGLRKRLFLLANRAVDTTGPLIEADTCEDGMTVTFDDMGLDVLLHEAQSLPLEQREEPLLRLARGKARLAQVKQSARQLIESRKARQETVHEAEVHLAFRIGLAERLDLPWQARRMLYSHEANVDKATLEQASQAILAEERLPGEMARRLLEQPFWEDYLETRFGQTRLQEPRQQRDEMIGALDDLLDAQREWFTGSDLDSTRKTELQQLISQSARTLDLLQSEVFIQPLKDSAYKSHAERIAKSYRRHLAQLTEELRRQHGL